ncbi:hypothetical protein HD806DRAFT_508396 [Xylariaceae sp. AK1471]|nr:hypothetical protein HD806DRAFT_508396 [Xylariaceae sp. AK1471]
MDRIEDNRMLLPIVSSLSSTSYLLESDNFHPVSYSVLDIPIRSSPSSFHTAESENQPPFLTHRESHGETRHQHSAPDPGVCGNRSSRITCTLFSLPLSASIFFSLSSAELKVRVRNANPCRSSLTAGYLIWNLQRNTSNHWMENILHRRRPSMHT